MRKDLSQASCTDLNIAYSQYATLVDILRWRALNQPDQQAYTFLIDGEAEEASITYAQLDQQARSIAATLQEYGVIGESALLLYQPGLDYISAFLGCLYAGIIAVPAYPPSSNRSLSRIQAIAADAQAVSILTTSNTLSKVQNWCEQLPELGAMRWIATDCYTEGREDRWQKHELTPTMLTFLQYTSGSTGTPKGVMVSHGNLMHNSAMMSKRWAHSSKSVEVSWLPMFHDMGLIAGVLQPLYVGFPAILMAPVAFIQRPLRWLQAISKYKATTSWAPNFAYELCIRRITVEERAQLDLSSWRVAGNGAEPVRTETIDRFVEVFGPCGFRREAVTPGYGLAEGTLMVSSSPEGVVPTISHLDKAQLEQHRVVERSAEKGITQAFVGCGSGAEDQRVVIVHPESRVECKQNEVGEIWVAGPSVTKGYWQRSKETERTFQAFLVETGEGPFLRTGDLGFLYKGEVFITGRLKDVIIIRGRNYYPQDIELTVEQSHALLRPGCGAAFSVEIANEERLVVVQEVLRDSQDTETIFNVVRQAVAEQHEIQVYAIVLIGYGSILKTSSGKIQRHACRDAFLAGHLHVVANNIIEEVTIAQDQEQLTRAMVLDMAPEEQKTRLQSYLLMQISSILRIDISNLDKDVPISIFGLDSLKATELQIHLEDDLEIVIPFVNFLQDVTVADLTARILDQIVGNSSHSTVHSLIRSTQRASEYLLSSSQEQLWVLNQLEPESSFYNISVALRIRGKLNVAILEQSIYEIALRHEALRTTIQMKEERLVQCIHPTPSTRLSVIDLQALQTYNKRLAEAQRQVQQETQQPFNLSRDALLRVTLLSLEEEEHILLLTMHHIVSDGWSVGLFVQELALIYNAIRTTNPILLPPLPIQYADYALWQREWLKGEALEIELTYWKQQLDNLPVLDLPTDRPRPAIQTYRGARQRFVLSQDLKQKYKELSNQEGVTLFMALLAVFQTLLSRYTGQEEIVVGTVVANRPKAELKGMIGFFVNTLVLRTKVSGLFSFRDLLKHIRKICLDAYAHQDLPFTKLVTELRPERDLSRNPLFQVIFTWQHGVLEELEIPGLVLHPFEFDSTTAKFDLSIDMVDSKQSLVGTVEYNTDLFDATTIARLIAHFHMLLEGIAADPDQKLSILSLLTPEDYQQMLGEGGASHIDSAYHLCLHELFEAQVEQTPEAIAVVFGEKHLTYCELNQRSNQVAHYLQARGVGPNVPVGICLGRSLDLIVGLLGILKAGGAYVPLDPSYPQERLAFMTTGIHMSTVVTLSQVLARLPENDLPLVCLDSEWNQIEQQSRQNLERNVGVDHLIYVVYTSGSTGQPKGAGVCHRGFVNLLRWFISEFGITSNDHALLVSALSFDLTQKNIFAPLLVGGRVSLLASDYYDVLLITQSLHEQNITLLNCTPSAFYPLIDQLDAGLLARFPTLRYVFLGGEPISVQRVWKWLISSPTEIVNTYGPTECTDVVAFYHLKGPEHFLASPVPIGKPIWNTRLLVLDATLHLLPVGAIGELYIAGEGVGNGYLNDEALTAAKFLPDPFSDVPGKRLFKTGDLVRYRHSGDLEFCGRVDHQVKLRGYRIELGEIEAVLDLHPAIRESAVIVREDVPGNQRLVAYVVPVETGDPVQIQQGLSNRQLYKYLQDKLANYMLPAHFVVLEAFPLTPSAKLDRQALPAPDEAHPGKEGAVNAPRTAIEEVLTVLWSEVLGLRRVGMHDNFFELGGHSLLGTQLISRIRTVLQVELPLRSLFEAPSIAEQAEYMKTRMNMGSGPNVPPLVPVARTADLPLSFAQQRLWFLYQLMPDSSSYATPLPIRLQGRLQVSIVQRSLEEIIRRHEILRTSFAVRKGHAVQIISPSHSLLFPIIDLQGLHRETQEAEVERLIDEDAQRPFDLVRGSLLRTYLLRLSIEMHVLAFTTHHIIFDGWSQSVMLNELAILYEAFYMSKPSPLADLPIQYADFSLWQRTWLQGDVLEAQIRYWTEQLRGVSPLRLPTDHPRPAIQGYHGASHFFALPSQLSRALITLSRQEAVTLFMTLLVAFQTLLYRYSDQEDIVVGTDIANRSVTETEALIGFFVNILVLRTKFTGKPQFREVLRYAREMVLSAYAHQDLPFEKLVDVLQLERTMNQLPLVNVLFVFQNLPQPSLRTQGLTISPITVGVSSTKFDLALFMWEGQDGLAGAINYSTTLFERDTIKKMIGHFERILQSAVANPAADVDRIEMYTEEEREQLLSKEALYRETYRHKLKTARRNVVNLPDGLL